MLAHLSLPTYITLSLSISPFFPYHSFCCGSTRSSPPTFHVMVPNDCSQSSASWGFCWRLAASGTSPLPLTLHSDYFRENIYTASAVLFSNSLYKAKARQLLKVSYNSNEQLKLFANFFFYSLRSWRRIKKRAKEIIDYFCKDFSIPHENYPPHFCSSFCFSSSSVSFQEVMFHI